MHFIGDVHGKIQPFLHLLEQVGDAPCLQLGDMGLGFGGVSLPQLAPQHRFIRGNHDDPAACQAHPSYAGECGYDDAFKLFFLGGAWSIDYGWRQAWNAKQAEVHKNTPGPHKLPKVWWEDEELSQEVLDEAIALFIASKPELVATHEAPTDAAKYILSGGFRPEKAECAITRTSRALQKMFEAHQPRHWVFGHYHRDLNFQLVKDNVVIPTQFHCLNELTLREFS